MKIFRFRSFPIKKKMLVISMLTTLVALLLISTGLIINELFSFRKHLINELTIQAKIIGSNSAAALTFNNSEDAEENLKGLRAAPNIIHAILYGKNDTVFAKYLRDPKEKVFPVRAPQEGSYFAPRYLEHSHRIFLDQEFIGTVLIRSDLKQLYSRLLGHMLTVLLIMGGSLLVAFILYSKLQEAIIQPILKLGELMKIVSQDKKYSLRAEVHSHDELGLLTAGFNEMLSEIEARDKELEKNRQYLEEQVASRTMELVRTNKQLEKELKERQKAEESLRERERFLAEMFVSIQDGIIILDLDFNIIRVNPALGEWYSNVPSLVGQKCYRVFHGLDQPCPDCLTKKTMETGIGVSEIIVQKERNGENKKWLEVYSFPLSDKVTGKIKGVIQYLRDITQQKRAEEEKKHLEDQLRQAQKMEAVGRLAGGVAHDFNNLLTVIKGYNQLSMLELRRDHPLFSNLEQVQKAAERAARLTSQLLAFGRRQILEVKIVNLNNLLQDLHKMLRRILPENIELVNILHENLGSIKVDPNQMEQVILNLVVNAKDAMPEGGKLTFTTTNLNLDQNNMPDAELTPGQYVMLSIADTGVGMSNEIKEKIFEPFFTTKEKGKGTGLGLSTVYGIVKQSGGSITVESEPGKGTNFKIYFPKIEGNLNLDKKEEGVDRLLGGKEKILLVEDEIAVRKLAVHVLRDLGYEVIEASNGEEGLSLAQEYSQGDIHLLLTDVVMPKMGGKDLAEKIKTFFPHIRILFSSGHIDDSAFLQNLMDSGNFFLEKPFSPSSLARKVREVLDA